MPSVKPRIHPKSKHVEPFDRMLRRFKKACEKADIVGEVRKREYHIKPNELKNQKNQDLKRRRKLEKKRSEQKGYRRR